tara:strand:+ start:1829 stop:3622 length:1794 start_codon:yes stop_codon:yes gene_type:complete
MKNRLKYKLRESSSKDDINQDTFLQVGFDGERKLIPVGEMNHVVDVGAEFDKERNKSKLYRLQGTVCPLFSNPLMNVTTNPIIDFTVTNNTINKVGNGLDVFNIDYFLKDQTSSDVSSATFINDIGQEDLTYKESLNSYLEEKDGWFGFTDPDITKSGFCEFIDMEPTRSRFDLNSSINKNWELTVTYPYDSDDTHYVVNGGLLIVSAAEVEVGGITMLALGTSTQHGLENGDRVRLTGMTASYNGDHTVKRLGLNNGDYLANYFVIDVKPTTLGIISGGARMKKLVSGEPSTYYLRKFKKILLNNDYEMYPLGFSRTIFNDMNYQFIINEDINVGFDDSGNPIRDNLGRPLSELYVTFIKTDSNNMFGPLKSGLDLEFIEGNLNDVNISNVRRIHDGSPSTSSFDSHNTLPGENDLYNNFSSKDWFYGDVVEYNRFTLKETKLANVLHRFNTVNRENANSTTLAKGPRREGYLYNPHYLFKIREFSLYIEQGDENTGGIPDYSEYLGVDDGRYLWRDLLDIGIYDGEGEELNYPFTNGAHYLHKNICLVTKRQDPFGQYDLYYQGNITGNGPFDPPDPRGDALTDNFTIKKGQDVC